MSLGQLKCGARGGPIKVCGNGFREPGKNIEMSEPDADDGGVFNFLVMGVKQAVDTTQLVNSQLYGRCKREIEKS